MLEPWSSVRARLLARFGGPADKLNMASALVQGLILDEVRRGNVVPIVFYDVPVRVGDLTAVYRASADALQIGVVGDSWRVNVTAKTAQHLADLLSAVVPTPLLRDAAWRAAIEHIEPVFVQDRNQRARSDLDAGETHSRKVGERIASVHAEGKLVRGVGKAWVLSRKLSPAAAVNYDYPTSAPTGPEGKKPWPSATTLGARVWQPVADRHGRDHTDASQTFDVWDERARLVSAGGESELHVAELAALAGGKLFSHEGEIPTRDPWVSSCAPVGEGGACPDDEGGGIPPSNGPPPAVAGPSSARRVVAAGVTFALAAGAVAYDLRR